MRRTLLMMALVSGWAATPEARGAGPADGLLRLAPPDSGLTLAVEGLRDQLREIDGSPLMAGLRRLPLARAWFASERHRTLDRAARDIEAALRLPFAKIRDEILGDAVVLVFRPDPGGRSEEARGLLLALPRDPAMVDRLMAALNEAQIKGKELVGVVAKARGAARYSARNFQAGGRPAEYYATLDGGVFAWSNSEDLIAGVIDRKLAGTPGLGDDPAFQKVRRGLPARSIASLFLNPRLVERAMADAPRPARPAEERLSAMLARYVGAVGYAGASLEWRDGLAVHTHEAVDPARLDPWLRGWLTGPKAGGKLPGLVPESALAVVSAVVDYQALLGAVAELMPQDDPARLDNIKLGLQGVLLGRDPVAEVLPRLGPGTLFYVESNPRFPLVAALDWKPRADGDDLAAPLDNALRTLLALYALDPKRQLAHLRVEAQSIGGTRVTTLTGGLRPVLCYRVDRGRVVFGNDPAEVARFGNAPPMTLASDLRARYFPDAETFAVVDLGRLVREVRNLRGPIAGRLAARSGRPVGVVDRELGNYLALLDLFRAATFTSVASPDAAEIHRTLGLIAR